MCSTCSAIIGLPPEPTGRTPWTSLGGAAGYARSMDTPGPAEVATYLRAPAETDREAFVALRQASAESLALWEPRMGDDDEQFGEQSFDRLLDRRDSESEAPFLIHRTSDDEILGYVGLGQIVRGPFQSCYIGYWIGDPYVGRGYGTSGVRACLRTAFTPEPEGGLGLHRVEANIIPTNHASTCARPPRRHAQGGVQPAVSRDQRRVARS